MITQKYLDDLTYEIIGAAIEVQKTVGRGLLEKVYQECMIEEMKHRKINFSSELAVPLMYKNKSLQTDFRCDFLVEDCLVVEIKSVNEMNTIYEAQLLTYMKLLKMPKGLLLNFNCMNIFKHGQKTMINDYFRNLPKK
ncbi:MAG: GxxExxY protein [Chitinophagales bacterium]